MKDDYRYTGTLFKRSPLVSPTGEGFAAKVRAVVADHARQLQGPAGAMAGKKRTWLPGGILVETWINPFGLTPTLMARVTYPGGKVVEEEFWCESGLLYWDPLAPEYPLVVYVGDKLRTLTIPKKITDNHYDSSYWLDTRPDIEYQDFLNFGYTDRTHWPSFWTGRARLMLQALHAKQRPPLDIFDSGIDPLSQGIWHKAGHYFVVNISDLNGVTVTKLKIPDVVDYKITQALETLARDELSEIERNVAEACVMGVLEIGGEPVEILSAATIEGIYTEGFAMSYGWKFSRNKLEASIVTFREECMPEFEETCIGQFVTSLFTITADYSIAEDAWTCTSEQVYGPERSRPRTAITSIYVPLYGNAIWGMDGKVPGWGESIQPACCYDPIGDTISPYYCFYDKQDVLQVVWYVQFQHYFETIDTRLTGSLCEGSFSWSAEWGEFGEQHGGFHLGPEPPLVADFIDAQHAYTEGAYSVTHSAGSGTIVEVDSPTTSDTNFYSAVNLFCSGGELGTWYNEHSPYLNPPNAEGSVGYVVMTSYYGSTAESLTSQYFSAAPRVWSFVVSPHDAEAVYVFNRQGTDTTNDKIAESYSSSYYGDASKPVWGGSVNFKFYSTGDPATVLKDVTLTDMIRDNQTPGQYLVGTWVGWLFNFLDYNEGSVIEMGSETVKPARNILATPHGTIELAPDAHVSSFFPDSVLEGEFIEQQPLRAIMSYTGDSGYFKEEGNLIFTGGYTIDPFLKAFFIGGA